MKREWIKFDNWQGRWFSNTRWYEVSCDTIQNCDDRPIPIRNFTIAEPGATWVRVNIDPHIDGWLKELGAVRI